MEKSFVEIDIDFGKVFSQVFQKRFIILITSCAVALMTIIYLGIITPAEYRITSKIYIVEKENITNYSNLQYLSREVREYMKSEGMLKEVIEQNQDKKIDLEDLKVKLLLSSNGGRIITATIRGTNVQEMKEIMDSFIKISSKKVVSDLKISEVRVLEESSEPKKVERHIIKKSLMYFFATAIGFVLIELLIRLFDNKIYSRDDLKNDILDTELLGIIPKDNL
ncbi:Wzz/FepE/Etk N-terminal domain-containing protein [Parvimonas micra]|mgnify:CR=1 FL=1|jgi:Capsular polysaccharide biosynthesis protein|uniref:Wzz/FepE/Etk N-terminal domain-containing protein n=1 Tax=Parvimonas TaxID=543311 RepID=UPI00020DDFBB|nr:MULTISPECIES: Wzz/FepE/Etk N-terminal domain-containing protein [unclassified Parvimonas]EGL35627.1 chain length determinant protein [Parvimonas sp. oral taxon 110 str. F0139]MEB3012772.1 Wzz/FepE/Etk N-terminal domain-containing protein [Parvimonas sp. D2]MEB3088211.1 Wzz/FepE/Etk N-terminal domain-containing protein [Parvimonas sp. D4]